MRKLLIVLSFLFLAFLFNLNNDVVVGAQEYYDICDDVNIVGSSKNYRKCSNHNIYVDMENKAHSSFLTSSREAFADDQIVYVGKVNGFSTFYSIGFHYYGFVHDERNVDYHEGDYWTTVSIDGITVYDGKFTDNWFANESVTDRVFFNQRGTYLITQFVSGKASNTIRVIVVDEDNKDMSINSIKYGDRIIGDEDLIETTDDLFIFVNDSNYGYNKRVYIELNECKFNLFFNKEIVLKYDDFGDCLFHNDRNNLKITLQNGLNMEQTFKYRFNLVSSKITINLKNSVSKLETSSRRIVINAKAGNGKELDEKYKLYYWSKNEDDELSYEAFMDNYESSQYKGTYTDSKGVILRDTTGTYYLYALAKDDDSTLVVRSEEYVLTESKQINKIIIDDVIIVCVLGVLAILPIAIYLIIRVKDTY